MDQINKAGHPIVRVGLILLFLATSFLVFFVFFNGASILGMMRDLRLGFSQKVAVVQDIQVAVTLGSLTRAFPFASLRPLRTLPPNGGFRRVGYARDATRGTLRSRRATLPISRTEMERERSFGDLQWLMPLKRLMVA